MKNINLIIVTGLLTYSAAGLAAEETKSPWVSTAELGYVNVSGNTETETVKAAVDADYSVDQWVHKVHADALSSTSEIEVSPTQSQSNRSAAKWLLSGQSDYKFNDSDYAYGLVSYEDDRFSGFQYQAKLGLGYGRRVIHTDVHELKLEVGPGYRMFKLEPPATDLSRQSDSFVRAAAGYIWIISPTATFTEDLSAEFGKDQDELKSVTALTANISGALAMKVSYTIKHLDVVPSGSDKTDKEAAVTLVYKF